MTSTRRRIRNRLKRLHTAELRRHEREVDGVASIPWPRQGNEQTLHAKEHVQVVDRKAEERQQPLHAKEQVQADDREVEERQWHVTWGIKPS